MCVRENVVRDLLAFNGPLVVGAIESLLVNFYIEDMNDLVEIYNNNWTMPIPLIQIHFGWTNIGY